MTDSSTWRASIPDATSGTSDTSRRSIVPTDYHDLSPLDALAAQGRLLNKRLTQHSRKNSEEPIPNGLDRSVFPKFGTDEIHEDRVFHGYDRRNRLPDRRRADDQERDPAESLSLATMSLLSPRNTANFERAPSQASSVLSIDTSSDGSLTPTEDYLPSRIYQAPRQSDPPRLRPVKTQHFNQPQSPDQSPTTPDQPSFPRFIQRPFSPDTSRTLDRPRIPSPLLSRQAPESRRTPSINFSRPYSSRSTFSDESAYETNEVDYFATRAPSLTIDTRLSVPHMSPATESAASSPGLEEEDINNLPRGRRKSRPVDTGVFFHSKSIKSSNSAHRWPQTPVTPTNQRHFFPSPEAPLPQTASSTGRRTPSTELERPYQERTHRPSTSSSLDHSPRPPHHVRRPSTAPRPRSQESIHPHTLHPPGPNDIFSSPTQVLSPRSTTSTSIHPPDHTITAEEHVTLAIKYHQEDQLPQSTHHFQKAAEMGSPTGMLLYSLSLRHGWGCAANPQKAVEYLHLAAENASAQVDTVQHAPAVMGEKGGSATLALAIYELGQSYMHGWGVQKDKHLALRCFEISANFGDTDGQCETAWCYLHGIGTKKNVKIAARYYRMAEKRGVKSVGLSWIWKSKYDESENVKGRSSVDGNGTPKKGKKLWGRKNSA